MGVYVKTSAVDVLSANMFYSIYVRCFLNSSFLFSIIYELQMH